MSVDYAFAEGAPGDREDQGLVQRARAGDRDALEALIKRHQGWIYNIAVRMLFHPQDAEDATQEILVKVVTRLASFEGRSSVRTWLYRIVVNHVLNMKRGRVEDPSLSFRAYGEERQYSGHRAVRAKRLVSRGRDAGDRSDARLHYRHAALPRS